MITTGPLGPADLDAVLAVWVACEEHDDGAAEVSRDDLVAMIGRPSFDFARDSVGIREDGALAGFGVQIGTRLTFAFVHPAARGRGLGTWLLGWAEAAARELGARACTQSLSEQDAAARALFAAHGYEPRWEDWFFALDLAAEPAPPALPPGYAIRPLGAGDERVAYDVIDRAFSEWPDRDGSSFEDWSASSRSGAPASSRRCWRSPCAATRSPARCCWWSRGTRAGSTSSRSRASTAAAGWRARCSSTRSARRGAAACAGPGCRRTRARARAGSTSTSGCTSARRTPSSRSRCEMRDTSAAMAATHAKRLLLLALMALAAVNLFTGAPLLAIWVGAQVQGEAGGLSMTAVLTVIVVMGLLCAGLVWALDRMGAAHDALAGRTTARRQTTWMKPFNSGPAHAPAGGLSALDKVLIGAVVLAGLAFEAWFFFFAGSSIGSG